MKFGIGQSVVRKEDHRFITGSGHYVEDAVHPHALHAAFVRSPVPHAKLISVDCDAANSMPGVVQILTGADYVEDGLGGLGCHTILPGMHKPNAVVPTPALATDRMRYVGALVAVVLAETKQQAKDAAELVEIDYEDLDVLLTPEDALAEGAPALWDSVPDNIAFRVDLGNAEATKAALDSAHQVVRLSLSNNRLSANSMET